MITDLSHEMFYYDGKPFWTIMQDDARGGAETWDVTIREPFWVFALLDEDQFWYFHLDEGDDPQVYWFCGFHRRPDGTEYAGSVATGRTFSEYINALIVHRKRVG